MVIGARRPGRPRRPAAVPGPPRARERARPDLARPLRRGRPDRHRRRRPGRLHRRPARARGARATATTAPIERVDPSWISAVAMIPDARPRRHRRPLDRAGRGRARARCRARRSPGSATSPGASWSSAAPPIARPTCCSRGPSGDRRDAGQRRVVRRQRGALERLDRRPRRAATSTTSKGSRPAASGSGRTRSSCSATWPGKSLLHLQCHFGIDTLSWARLGRAGHGCGPVARRDRAGPGARRRAGLPRRPLRPLEPVRPAGRARGHVRHRLHVARRPRLAARHPGLGTGRRPLPGPGRDVLHHRGPPGHERLRERGRRARRAAPRPTRTGSTASR